jgi:hypothetical protein
MHRWSGIDVPTSLYLGVLGSDALYRFSGQRESILRIISAAKSMLSRNAILACWRGFAFQRGEFPARKDFGDDAKGSFAAFVDLFVDRVLRKDLRQRKGARVYYFLFHVSQNSLTVPGPYPA